MICIWADVFKTTGTVIKMQTSENPAVIQKYPAIADLKKLSEKRLPRFAYSYLETGTGDESALSRNIDQMKKITMIPRVLKGELEPDISTVLFKQKYKAPFGVAPVGMTGVIWPNTDQILAGTGKKYQIPFCLSTVGSETPETIGRIAGDSGWFQLYSPKDKEVRDDLLKRVSEAGFTTLIVTADVPVPSRRERMMRAGIKMPPAITPDLLFQTLTHPAWALSTLKHGLPSLKTMIKYAGTKNMAELAQYTEKNIGGTLSWEYLKEVRDIWKKPLVLKGILHPDDIKKAIEIGVDGVVVSNHGARQFDGAPASIDMLPCVVEQFRGKTAIMFDSGIYSGLDILRAIALGADFVFLGRAFMYGTAALGVHGGNHVADILIDDLKINMKQLGAASLKEIKYSLKRG